MEIKLNVAAPPPYLRQDMTVSVDVEAARRNGVLALPGRSVRDALSAHPWVMVLHNGRAQPQAVTLGIIGNSRTEIRAGLLGLAGAVIGAAVGVGGLYWWHAAVRQVDGTELFPIILQPRLFIATIALAPLTGLLSADVTP
jgi:multidrug efflux pump subunit AcrA (membrane-fusion protein)